MEHFKTILKKVESKKFTITTTKKGEKIKQTEHRKLKTDIMNALLADFKDMKIAVGMNKEGIVLELPNSHEGSIPATIDIKIKSFDFDTVHETEAYAKEQELKVKKRKQRKKHAKSAYNQARKVKEKEQDDYLHMRLQMKNRKNS